MLLPHCCRFLALPTAKIIQFRATRASLLLHFYLCDPRRMERKNPLDTLAVGDAAHSECFVESASFATNHNASKYLDSFFVSFHDSRVNAYAIANRKLRQIAFFLFFLDSIDDLVHKLVQATRLRAHTLIRRCRLCNLNSCSSWPSGTRARVRSRVGAYVEIICETLRNLWLIPVLNRARSSTG